MDADSAKQPHAKQPAFLFSPRCGAKTRKGTPCRAPAMKNGRCRMHGGKSPGAPKGNKNALKHGAYTSEAIEDRKRAQAFCLEAHRILEQIGGAGYNEA